MPKQKDDVMRSDDAVAEQARSFDAPGTPWYAVAHGTLEDIVSIFPERRCVRPHHRGVTADDPCEVCGCRADVFDTGAVGENILHICVLFHTPETLRMARYLVRKFGAPLVNAPYQQRRRVTDQPGLYEGETALHIAIVHRDAELVEFLLKHGARLDVHAVGGFFAPGRVYFGETPLAFAASTGATELIDILLRHAFERGGKKLRADVLNDADALGNTAAHMAVVNNRLDCYDYLVDKCGLSESVENNAGLTPFLLAARDGNAHAFNRVLRRKFGEVWRFGPVTSYNLNLTGIDTVGAKPADKPENAGECYAFSLPTQMPNYHPNTDRTPPRHLLPVDVLVRSHHISLLSHPVLVAVLDLKWRRFAKAAFLRHLVCYAAFLALFTWLVHEHVTRREGNELSGARRAVAEWSCFGCVAAMFYLHIRDLRFYARKYYRSLKIRNGKASDVPMYCVPGHRADRRCNPRQAPRELRRTRKGAMARSGGSFKDAGDSTTSISTVNVSSTSIDEEGAVPSVGELQTPPLSPQTSTAKPLPKKESSMVGTFHLFDATDGGARGEGASTPGSAFRKTRSRSLFRRMPSFFGGSNGKRVDGYLCDSMASIGGGEDDAAEAFSRVDVRSSIARGRWRLLRERWMEQRYPIVKSHQTMKRLSLMRADDVDDRVVVLLRVNVLGARGLPAADSDGKSDPYCVVQPAPGVSARTRPVMNTLDPLWHRAFTFTAPCGLRRSGNSVVLSVIDYDGYDEADEDGDDPLGFAAIAHHDVQYVGPGMIPPGPVWLDLMPARKDAEARAAEHSRSLLKRYTAGHGDESAEDANGGAETDVKPVGQILAEVYYEVAGKSSRGSTTALASLSSPEKQTSKRQTKKQELAGRIYTDFYPRDEPAIHHRAAVNDVQNLKRLNALGFEFAGEEKDVPPNMSYVEKAIDGEGGAEGGADGGWSGSDESDDEGEETVVAEAVAEMRRALRNSKTGLRHAGAAAMNWITSVFVPQPLMWINLTHLVLHTVHFVEWNVSKTPSVRDDVVFSLAALAAWGFVMYFVATSRSVGHLVVIVTRCIKDVVKFSALWIVTMLAFSQAFYVLDAGWLGDPTLRPITTFGDVMWKLFAVATAAEGDYMFPEVEVSSGGVELMYTVLVVAYQVLMSVLMLNVIIAMFNHTFSTVSDRSRDEWTMQWALKVLLAEARLTPAERFKHRLGTEVDGVGSQRAQNFEINFAEGMLEKGSVEAAICELLREEPKGGV